MSRFGVGQNPRQYGPYYPHKNKTQFFEAEAERLGKDLAALRAELAQVKAEREARWIAAKVEAYRDAARIVGNKWIDDDSHTRATIIEVLNERAGELEKPAPPPSENGAGLEEV